MEFKEGGFIFKSFFFFLKAKLTLQKPARNIDLSSLESKTLIYGRFKWKCGAMDVSMSNAGHALNPKEEETLAGIHAALQKWHNPKWIRVCFHSPIHPLMQPFFFLCLQFWPSYIALLVQK